MQQQPPGNKAPLDYGEWVEGKECERAAQRKGKEQQQRTGRKFNKQFISCATINRSVGALMVVVLVVVVGSAESFILVADCLGMIRE